jgi:hypothetical protein
MPVVITNLTSSPLYVPLNSGSNLRLSPGAASIDVNDVELKDNLQIDKLRRMRAIAIETRTAPADEKSPAEPAQSEAAKSTPAPTPEPAAETKAAAPVSKK